MASSLDSLPILDHIVILISHSTLRNLPTSITDSFTISPGGEHADGLTSNKLILFRDGTYFELIAFHDDADPEKKSQHRWGRARENTIIDWAYTLPHERDFGSVQQRLAGSDAGFHYQDPVPGGRTRPDGVVLKWSIGSALDADGKAIRPGSLPFWCLDRTPRNLRVPYEDDAAGTSHPSGALGVSRVALALPEGDQPGLRRAYDAIHAVTLPGDELHFLAPSGPGSDGGTLELTEGFGAVSLSLRGSQGSPQALEFLPGLILSFD